MPNTPMLLGLGVTALCKNDLVSENEFEFVTSLFASSGDTIELKEDEINAITAVTSSSPAYVYTFIKGMLEGAKRLGLDYDNMLDVICKTIIGSVHMVLTKEKSVDDLIRMVKSPNGTTERALNVFDENNFTKTIEDAMIACSNRAEELAKLN
jgi:pyrroline-5-carboxylate reductase